MLWTLSLLTLVCWYCNTLLRMLILLSTESNNHDCFPGNLPPDQTWNELTFEMLCAKKRWSTWSWKMTSSFSSSLIVGIRFKVQFFVPLCKCWNTQINSVSASLCWNIQRGPSLSMVLKLSDPVCSLSLLLPLLCPLWTDSWSTWCHHLHLETTSKSTAAENPSSKLPIN